MPNKPIGDLKVACRYAQLKRGRDPGRYDSVECGQHATSGVVEPSPHFTGVSWRCNDHRGLLRPGVAADIIKTADRNDYLRYRA